MAWGHLNCVEGRIENMSIYSNSPNLEVFLPHSQVSRPCWNILCWLLGFSQGVRQHFSFLEILGSARVIHACLVCIIPLWSEVGWKALPQTAATSYAMIPGPPAGDCPLSWAGRSYPPKPPMTRVKELMVAVCSRLPFPQEAGKSPASPSA